MALNGEVNASTGIPIERMAGGSPKIQQLVVAGPSGSGKSTLLRKLFEEFPNEFGFSISRKFMLQVATNTSDNCFCSSKRLFCSFAWDFD